MRLRKTWLGLCCLAVSVFPAILNAAGRDAFSSLLVTPTPRAAALGEAFASVAEGPETVLYNPSGLGFEKLPHLYLQSFVPYFVEGIKYSNLIFVRPTRDGAWAFQAGALYADGFKRTVADASSPDGYSETGGFSAYDLQLSMTSGKKVGERLSLGYGFRYIRESLSDVTANAYGFDFGFLYLDEQYPLKLGVAIQNLGLTSKFKNESFSLPSILRVGLTLNQPKNSGLKFVPEKSLVTAEYDRPLRGDDSLRGGVEVPVLSQLFLRSGYQHSFKKQEAGSNLNLPSGITFGLGIDFKSWQLDYALVSMGELGLAHRVALDLRWGLN